MRKGVTMSYDNYYYRRAEQELQMAQRAVNPSAVRAHYELANHYLERLGPQERAVPSIWCR